jgi:hypothetical protein
MPEPALIRPGVVPLICERVAASVAEHVRVRLEADAHTILLTPQKNGSGPWVTPATLVRQACCCRKTPSGA